MHDFLIALGLVCVIEGLVFAAFPGPAKRAVMVILETPDGPLRLLGLGSATFGVLVIWFLRG